MHYSDQKLQVSQPHPQYQSKSGTSGGGHLRAWALRANQQVQHALQ